MTMEQLTKAKAAKLLNISIPTLTTWIDNKIIVEPMSVESLLSNFSSFVKINNAASKQSSQSALKDKKIQKQIELLDAQVLKTQDKYVLRTDFEETIEKLAVKFLDVVKSTANHIKTIARSNAPVDTASIISAQSEDALRQMTENISSIIRTNHDS